MRPDETTRHDRDAAPDHGGRSEQAARVAGEHGWGYGGRPSFAAESDAPPATPRANASPDSTSADVTNPDAAAATLSTDDNTQRTQEPSPAVPPDSSAEIAPTDLGGHHPDWRR